MLKNAPSRLLTCTAHKRDSVLLRTYRAATVRERSSASLFQHPARESSASKACPLLHNLKRCRGVQRDLTIRRDQCQIFHRHLSN